MVIGKDTNTAYFSTIIQHKHPKVFQELKAILIRNKISFEFIEGTQDIWCRDYMPIQVDRERFVQFQYQPSYLKRAADLRTDPSRVSVGYGLSPIISRINFDGGNLVNWSGIGMVTDRVFDENPGIPKHMVIEEMEELLRTEIIVIPQIKSDMTGHIDGMVRFVDDRTVIGNDRHMEYKYWARGVNRMLRNRAISYIDLPFFSLRSSSLPDNAIGCYVNFLEVGNLIVMPIFEVLGNRDNDAYDIIKATFKGRVIETINYNEIGKLGGLLNCTSWTILK